SEKSEIQNPGIRVHLKARRVLLLLFRGYCAPYSRRQGVTWEFRKLAYFWHLPELPRTPSSLDPQTTRGQTTIPTTKSGAFAASFGISCSSKFFSCKKISMQS
ncbi:hypothetical protein T310_9173, partial [Rasamsonia emersonii CBS 393.64]